VANSAATDAVDNTALPADRPITRGACRGGGAGLVESGGPDVGNGVADYRDAAGPALLFAR